LEFESNVHVTHYKMHVTPTADCIATGKAESKFLNQWIWSDIIWVNSLRHNSSLLLVYIVKILQKHNCNYNGTGHSAFLWQWLSKSNTVMSPQPLGRVVPVALYKSFQSQWWVDAKYTSLLGSKNTPPVAKLSVVMGVVDPVKPRFLPVCLMCKIWSLSVVLWAYFSPNLGTWSPPV